LSGRHRGGKKKEGKSYPGKNHTTAEAKVLWSKELPKLQNRNRIEKPQWHIIEKLKRDEQGGSSTT